MKKIITTILLVVLALSLVGCGGGLSELYGAKTKNITKIEYYNTLLGEILGPEKSLTTPDDIKELFGILNVGYTSCIEDEFALSSKCYVIHFTVDDVAQKLYLYMQDDNTVHAKMETTAGTVYAKSSEAVYIPALYQ